MKAPHDWLWVAGLFLVPFVLLTLAYDNVPDPVALFRAWDGRTIVGAKSWLTVFRPAVIDALSGFVAFWLGWRAARAPDRLLQETTEVWWRLFVTASLKSVMQGIELAQGVVPEAWRGRATLGSVAIVGLGVVWTLAALRTHWPVLRDTESWKLSRPERATLGLAAALYVLVAFGPVILRE